MFEHPTEYGVYKAKWEFDDKYHSDINVEISLTVNQEGYYSLPTPTISTLVEDDLGWESYQDFIRESTARIIPFILCLCTRAA